MHDVTHQYYDTHAEQFASRYRGANVTPLHNLLRRWLPPAGRVLEIGCGIGREAAYMSSLGLDVLATDASEPMLAQACLATGDARVIFQQAAFPVHPDHSLMQARFDAVVAIAMLMHVPDHELFDLAFQIRGLLNPGGRFICSFCSERSPSEEDKRLFVNREPGEVRLLFERLGFSFLAKEENEDGLGRDTRWTTLVFGYDHQPGARPVDQIESIINHDKKDATYKLALLRALCDIAQTSYRYVRWHPDGTVSVPLGLVTERWLYYYWPLVDTGSEPLIPQKRGMEINKTIAFRKELTALASHFRGQNGLSRFHGEFQAGILDPTACKLVDAALNKIAKTVVTGPVAFTSQGGFAFGDGPLSARNRCYNPQALYASLGRVYFNADVWRELCLVGHWISEAIILRWAELTVEISNRQTPITRVLEKLLVRPETDRDVYAVREIYKACPDLACVWTQTALTNRRFDVDHAIPFSLWHNNDLWNLLPADAKVNNEKRDRLVDRETLFRSRETIIGCWQITRSAMPARFDLEVSRTLFGRNHAESQWEDPAFAALSEAVETVALQRGVERWKPAFPASRLAKAPAFGVLRKASESITVDAVDSYYQSVSFPVLNVDGKRPIGHYHLLPLGLTLLNPSEVPHCAFKSALPIVAELAAGPFFDGFETGRMDDLNEVDWIAVPTNLCRRNRFVIRVAGDSMEPTFRIGDLLVFEYHRTPRQDRQIVIAADFTAGAEGGEYGIKRFKADHNKWLFLSDNPAYAPVEIPKGEMAYPILGTYVGPVFQSTINDHSDIDS